MNKSGIVPVGVSILVLPKQLDGKTASGIITATDAQLEREQMRQTDGIVVAVGPIAFYDEKDGHGNVVPRCKVGDRVVMKAYAGMIREGLDDLTYRLIADNDVVAIITEEK